MFEAAPAALVEALRQYRADSLLTRDANPEMAFADGPVTLLASQLAIRCPLSIRRCSGTCLLAEVINFSFRSYSA